MRHFPSLARIALATLACCLGGCAIVTVADTAASLAVSGVGLAADAAVGAVKITGKAVGAAADAVLPGDKQ
jgi:hypothetical protein